LSDLLPNGYIQKILDGISDFIIILYSYSDWGLRVYKVNKTSLATQEVVLENSLDNYVWNSWTLDHTRECFWLARYDSAAGGYIYVKHSISTGSLLHTISLGHYPNFERVVAAKNNFIVLKNYWPSMSLVAISYSTGEETVLNTDLLPGRLPLYDPGSKLILDSTGENVLLSSLGWNLKDPMLHVFSGNNGHLIQSFPIGQPGKDFYLNSMTISPIPGFIACANRTGDVSEPISASFSLNGTASNGLDYTFPTTPVSFLPGNTQQPLPFGLVNDNVVEFDETVVLRGTPNPDSDSSVQAFT
jgi:hypothetical protein